MRREVLITASLAVGLCAEDRPVFEVADVHIAPRTEWVKSGQNSMQGGILTAAIYHLRRATMLDLIRTAYNVDADKVFGGPNWLDYDRFEIVAKAPNDASPEQLREMLQALLADRFRLVLRAENRPLPAYVLSHGGTLKLTPARSSSDQGCRSGPALAAATPSVSFECRHVTMEAFAEALNRMTGAFGGLPLVDDTKLLGFWDIDFQYPIQPRSANASSNSPSDLQAITAAIAKLGLGLEEKNVSQPVLVVNGVNERPTPNPPGTAARLPALPSPAFEVAAIRPCDGTGPSLSPRFEAGGRVTAHCMGLVNLISQSWGLAPFQPLLGAPKWLSLENSPSISIEARAPPGTYLDTHGKPDRDVLNAMVRSLLIDRYHIKLHYEERPVDAYTLVAVRPKLTMANPADRTGCTRGILSGDRLELKCRNMTMTQFAEQIQGIDEVIFYPVQDGTHLDGAWDFSVTYSWNGDPILQDALSRIRSHLGVAQPTEPSGAVSFPEALDKQLGLRLVTKQRPERVLVFDHIEQTPTPN